LIFLYSRAIDRYPELKAIVQLAKDLAETRVMAEEAQRQATEATAKAELALENQHWQTIAEYVYLRQLTRQCPQSLYADFGRYLSGYCKEHQIPVPEIAVDKSWWMIGCPTSMHAKMILCPYTPADKWPQEVRGI
jgi:hypothetical protein